MDEKKVRPREVMGLALKRLRPHDNRRGLPEALMLVRSRIFCVVIMCLVPLMLSATINQLTSPTQISNPAVTINFDSYPSGTVTNLLYQSQGVVFSRHDGYAIPIFDWSSLGRSTTSPPNVIATISGTFQGQYVPTWSTDLELSFTQPTFALGAYFGNDQGGGGYTQTTLSVFDAQHVLLGSVVVPTNDNTSVDQFIGLTSTVPFAYAEFDNSGSFYSVVLDDVKYGSAVPEPGSLLLMGTGILGLAGAVRRKMMP